MNWLFRVEDSANSLKNIKIMPKEGKYSRSAWNLEYMEYDRLCYLNLMHWFQLLVRVLNPASDASLVAT